MEDGLQKSKRLSYKAKFKCEAVRCSKEKANHKAAAIFGLDESSAQLWQKHNTVISKCEVFTKEIQWTQERTIS
jgi:hypothetical protein